MQCYPHLGTADAAVAGTGLLVVALSLSLRRCSTPELPSFRGLLLITAYMTIGMGTLSLIVVVSSVVGAILAVIGIALVSLFRNDTVYARRQFRQLVEFYRRHRMYQ